MIGHVGVDALVASGRNRIALAEGAALEAALQRLGRSLEPDIVLGGCENDLGKLMRPVPHL